MDFTRLECCCEQELWVIIDGIKNFECRTKYDINVGRLPKDELVIKDLEKMALFRQEAVAQTKRFGVKQPINPGGNLSLDYRKWFSWWNRYIKQDLSMGQWRLFSNKIEAGDDVSKFRPKGSWQTLEEIDIIPL